MDNDIQTSAFESSPMLRGISHLVMSLIAVVAAWWLTSNAATGAPKIVATIYSVSLVWMFAASTTYQRFRDSHLANPLRRFDQAAIFAVAGATYLPFIVFAFNGIVEQLLLAAIIGVTAGGLVERLLLRPISRKVPYTLAVMFLLVTLAMIPQMFMKADFTTHLLIDLGGASYGIGLLVYLKKRPVLSPRYFGSHELFHLFVIGGAALQYAAVFRISS